MRAGFRKNLHTPDRGTLSALLSLSFKLLLDGDGSSSSIVTVLLVLFRAL